MTGRRSVRIACPRPSGRGNATILYDASRSDAELRRMWLLYVILSWHRSSAAHIIFFMLSHGSASLHRGLSTASAHPRLCGRHGISRTGKACKAEPTVARSVNSGDENNTIKKRSVGPIQNVAVGWSGVRSGGHRRGAPVWGACVGRLDISRLRRSLSYTLSPPHARRCATSRGAYHITRLLPLLKQFPRRNSMYSIDSKVLAERGCSMEQLYVRMIHIRNVSTEPS